MELVLESSRKDFFWHILYIMLWCYEYKHIVLVYQGFTKKATLNSWKFMNIHERVHSACAR